MEYGVSQHYDLLCFLKRVRHHGGTPGTSRAISSQVSLNCLSFSSSFYLNNVADKVRQLLVQLDLLLVILDSGLHSRLLVLQTSVLALHDLCHWESKRFHEFERTSEKKDVSYNYSSSSFKHKTKINFALRCSVPWCHCLRVASCWWCLLCWLWGYRLQGLPPQVWFPRETCLRVLSSLIVCVVSFWVWSNKNVR